MTTSICQDKYTFSQKDKLGNGAFGTVYKGQSTKQPQTQVAVKEILQSRTSLAERTALQNEIKVMTALDHPNIVNLLDSDQSKPGVTYLVQELANGGDLTNYIEKKSDKCISEKEALRKFVNILHGITDMEKKGIIHRDLKPDNILLHNGTCKIADFGLSQQVKNFGNSHLRQAAGTPLYMAPQLLKDETYTTKSDVWSLGIIFYYMLYGQTPWEANTLEELIYGIENVPVSFPDNTYLFGLIKISKVSDQTKKFIQGCLEVDENKRYSMDEVFLHPLFQNAFNWKSVLQKLNDETKIILKKLQTMIQQNQTDISELFQSIDVSGDRQLDIDEFEQLLRKIDPEITRQQVEYVFNDVDVDKSEFIDYEEFHTVFQGFHYENRRAIVQDQRQSPVKSFNQDQRQSPVKSFNHLRQKSRDSQAVPQQQFSILSQSQRFQPQRSSSFIQPLQPFQNSNYQGVVNSIQPVNNWRQSQYHTNYAQVNYGQAYQPQIRTGPLFSNIRSNKF